MAQLMEISSREYKVMLDQRLFLDRKKAAAMLWREVSLCGQRVRGIEHEGEFEKTKKREIVFLDTIDGAILQNGFIFRQRVGLEKGKTEYTLKCRSPDRHVASGANLETAEGLKGKAKFEEDIGPPFVARYSRSTSVDGDDDPPKHLEQAAGLFPALGELMRDGEPCSNKLEIRPTRSVTMFERVLTGPALKLATVDAEVALILWSDGSDGRPLVAEFSFRYADEEEENLNEAARAAMQFFGVLQRLDWCLPEGRTKTQYVYGES